MTRVLVLTDLYPPFPGGWERYVYNLAVHLQATGMDVHVLTAYEPARQFDGPPITAQPIGDGDGDPGWGPVSVMIGSYKPDVIVTGHHFARLFDADLAVTGIPVVQVVLNGQRLSHAAHAVYITEFVRSLDQSARLSDQTIWPWATPDVVSHDYGDAVGFIKPIPHKGVDLVYRIAEKMPERRFIVLRGEWQDLEVIRRLRNVEFMEPVHDIRDFWGRVNCVLVPSLSEDAGTVAQEATLNGVPCVSSDRGGLIETNGGGVMLDPTDLAPWLWAIRALDDPGERAVVVDRMRHHYEAHDHPARLAALADRIRELA